MPGEQTQSATNGKDVQKASGQTAIDKFAPDELRKKLKKIYWANCDPRMLIREFGELLKEFEQKPKDKKVAKQLEEKLREATAIVALDTHYRLAETVSEGLRPLVIEFANRLQDEYSCQTASEKALVEVVVSSYARIMENSKVLNRMTRSEYVSHEQNGFYSIISKELDRANRHFVSALTALRQVKSPTLEVQVRAKTAFISQNQQINAVPSEPNRPNYEINNPK